MLKLQQLSKNSLGQITHKQVIKPNYLDKHLPEKILQFGTGVLLKGLPDYFVDHANNLGQFNGKILAVKSTQGSAEINTLAAQDFLYTLHSQGVENGKIIEETRIIASLSQVIHAQEQWQRLVNAAQSAELEIVISNTTEIGLNAPEPADYDLDIPNSFPAKLLKLLKARYDFFAGDSSKGWIIIPTELVVDNGKVLQNVLSNLAETKGLEPAFVNWLNNANYFCNSLVDRIVTGKPSAEQQFSLEEKIGYTDSNLIFSESYSLWAIQASKQVASRLTFANEAIGCIVCEDIEQYRELKLRLLNAVHSSMVGYALAMGQQSVYEATSQSEIVEFIKEIQQEIIAALDIDPSLSQPYAASVLARFQNPAIVHKLLGITVQYSSKMKARVVPLIQKYAEKHGGELPRALVQGFAYFLKFMKVSRIENNSYYTALNGSVVQINDINAETFAKHQNLHDILKNTELWGADLSKIKGFEAALHAYF